MTSQQINENNNENTIPTEDILEDNVNDILKFNNPLQLESSINKIDLQNNTVDIWHLTKLIFIFVLKMIVVVIAIYLCWDCNRNSNIILRIIMTTFSAIFSELYIVYYSFYRILLGNRCY